MTEDPIKKQLSEQDRKYLFGGAATTFGFIGSIFWTGFVLLASPFLVVMMRANDRHAGTSWWPYIAGVLVYALFPWIVILAVILSGKRGKKKEGAE